MIHLIFSSGDPKYFVFQNIKLSLPATQSQLNEICKKHGFKWPQSGEHIVKRPPVSEMDMPKKSAIWHTAILQNDITTLVSLLDNCDTLEEKFLLMNDDNTPLRTTGFYFAIRYLPPNLMHFFFKHDYLLDINRPNIYMSSPISKAALSNHPNLVRELLKRGANVHLPDCQGWTPLLKGLESFEITKMLVNAGADVNHRSYHGTIALYEVIINGNIQTFKFLISKGANPNDSFVCKNLNWNLMLRAAYQKKYNILKYCFELNKLPQYSIDLNFSSVRQSVPKNILWGILHPHCRLGTPDEFSIIDWYLENGGHITHSNIKTGHIGALSKMLPL